MKFKFLIVVILCCLKSLSQEKELQYFLEKAQANSPLLTDYNNQIRSASLDSLLFRAGRKPQVAGNLNGNYAPVINGIGYDTALSNAHTFGALVGVNQRILTQNQINSQATTFKLIKEALVLNKRIAAKDLNKAITLQYIVASGTSEQIAYSQDIGLLLKRETLVLKNLTQHSVYKQTDYLIFSSTVKQQELVLLQLQQQYQNDLALLNYLSGETDTTFVKLKKPEIALRSISNMGKLLFLKQFEVDSLKLQNQNRLIDYNYRPSVSVLGDVGYWSSFASEAYKNFGFSVGLGISVPIYDGKQRILQHQKNDAALATNLAYKNNFNKQYKQQLLMLYQKLKQAMAIENQLRSQLTLTEALIEANRKLLLTGDAQITEYALAVNNLIATKNAVSQNNINKLQVINEINFFN